MALATSPEATQPPQTAQPGCDAPDANCKHPTFRTYLGIDGERHGFCAMVAGHAWDTMKAFPAAPEPRPILADARRVGGHL